MLTEEHVMEINAMEMMITMPWNSRKYNCVVLAKVGVGTSFKPYFKDPQEKKDLIEDLSRDAMMSIGNATKTIDNPKFCFIFAKHTAPITDVRQIIKAGGIPDSWPRRETGVPACPFV